MNFFLDAAAALAGGGGDLPELSFSVMDSTRSRKT